MRRRQELLTTILTSEFGNEMNYPNALTWADLRKAELSNEVIRTYKRLGGILEEPPLAFGPWDICLSNFIVELDEAQHFNRYRALSLNSYVYYVVKGFDTVEYTQYCRDHEETCRKKMVWGKFWTSSSAEHQFGPSGKIGDLESNGSPRWRQRAFYDYLRDVFATISGIPLIRVSVYDRIEANQQKLTVNEILLHENEAYFDGMVKFIERKVNRTT